MPDNHTQLWTSIRPGQKWHFTLLAIVPNHWLSKSGPSIKERIQQNPECLKEIQRFTEDGKTLFHGGTMFELKATHGVPLDFLLDKIVNEFGFAVSWIDFIEQSRKNGRWDFQTIKEIDYGLKDAMIDRQYAEGILIRCKIYMTQVAHPLLKEQTK